MRLRVLYIVLAVSIVLIWEYFGSIFPSVQILVSYPSSIVHYTIENSTNLFTATHTTFLEAVFGLLLAICFSFFIMILCFYMPRFKRFILPVMITSQVIPVIVLAPFFIILLGFGIASKVAMAAVISFFPIFVNFAQGYDAIHRNIEELMIINNASIWTKIKHIYFPLSAPSIFAGLKVSATLSVIGAIVAEFAGAQVGLGKNLFLSSIRLDPNLMMSSLLLSSFIGLFLFWLISMIERKLGYWYAK